MDTPESQQHTRLTLKHGLILWLSGSLTSFLLVSVFWTVFRNELDAARSLVIKADATFAQNQRLLDEVHQRLRDFEKLLNDMVEMGHKQVNSNQALLEKVVGMKENLEGVEKHLERMSKSVEPMSHDLAALKAPATTQAEQLEHIREDLRLLKESLENKPSAPASGKP